MTQDHEAQARALWSNLIGTSPLLTDEQSIEVITTALREASRQGVEEFTTGTRGQKTP